MGTRQVYTDSEIFHTNVPAHVSGDPERGLLRVHHHDLPFCRQQKVLALLHFQGIVLSYFQFAVRDRREGIAVEKSTQVSRAHSLHDWRRSALLQS